MVYLKKFDSHDAYEAAVSAMKNESVAYDSEHVHYVRTADSKINMPIENLDIQDNPLNEELD